MAAGTIGVGTTAAGTTGAAAMHTIAAISKVIVKVSAGAGTTVGAAVSLDIEPGRRIIPDLDRFDPGLFYRFAVIQIRRTRSVIGNFVRVAFSAFMF